MNEGRGKGGARLAAAVLLCVYAAIAVTSAREKSATVEEPGHLVAGLSYWRTQDFRLAPENGLLPAAWVALPLHTLGAVFPPLDQPAWWTSDQHRLGHQLLYETGNDPAICVTAGRAMVTILGVMLGIVVYLWSSEIYGVAGGLVSLALFAFHPSLIAHGQLATADLATALFFTLATWSTWKAMWVLSKRTFIVSVLSAAALLLCKTWAILFVPIAALLFLVRIVGGGPLRVGRRELGSRITQLPVLLLVGALQATVVVTLVWAAYGFRYDALLSSVPGRDRLAHGWEELRRDSGPLGEVIERARTEKGLPEPYLYGVTLGIRPEERLQFLHGRWSTQGWWWFLPYSFVVKTPLAMFLVLFCAFAAAIVRVGTVKPGEDERGGERSAAPLWILLIVYSTTAIGSRSNLGERHMLSALPALFVLAGASAFWFSEKARRAGVRSMPGLVVGALLLHAADSAFAYPHYLAYFNQLVGGPRNGYRHLVESSLDLGQDLPGLRKWLEDHEFGAGSRVPVFFSHFGPGRPGDYGIRAHRLPSFPEFNSGRSVVELTPGIYCVSATMLQAVFAGAERPWTESREREYHQLRVHVERFWSATPAGRDRLVDQRGREFWDRTFGRYDDLRCGRLAAYLRSREPDEQVGYSINVYVLKPDEVERVLHGPPVELSPS